MSAFWAAPSVCSARRLKTPKLREAHYESKIAEVGVGITENDAASYRETIEAVLKVLFKLKF